MTELEKWKHRAEVAEAIVAKLRSPLWPGVRARHLKKEPVCQACLTSEHLNVHHITPFHVDKAMELDASNLITLCETPEKHCHCHIGHLDNWHKHNPNVREDCAALRKKETVK